MLCCFAKAYCELDSSKDYDCATQQRPLGTKDKITNSTVNSVHHFSIYLLTKD